MDDGSSSLVFAFIVSGAIILAVLIALAFRRERRVLSFVAGAAVAWAGYFAAALFVSIVLDMGSSANVSPFWTAGGLVGAWIGVNIPAALSRLTGRTPASPATPSSWPGAASHKAALPSRVSGGNADVFISYKREERARVEAIASALRDLKLSVWFDARLQSGHSFDEEINREVRGAKAVLVCWSRGAVASEWVRAEASIGRQRGVLAACFLEACDLYPPFNLIHAEDLTAGALDGSNPAWTKIVQQIGVYVGRSGIGEYVALQSAGDRAGLGAWLADHAADPLADSVLARLRQA